MNRQRKVKNRQDRWYYLFCYTVVTILTLIVLYPVVFIIAASVSNSNIVIQGQVWLWPKEFTLRAYELVLERPQIWTGYRNTILYTAGGTLINLVITLMCAYPMARKNLPGRNIIMFIFSFTMMFSGGMIPTYMLVKNLGIMNTYWSIVLPGAMSVYNMIVCRTFIETNIPDEMLEAAQIDGCNNTQFFFQMVLPLSKAIIAVLALWYGVAHWNAYFNAFLYLRESDKYPLQIFLKEILVQSERMGGADMVEQSTIYETLKYSVIVISTAPLFCVYPFVQKYFQEGVMVGGVKG